MKKKHPQQRAPHAWLGTHATITGVRQEIRDGRRLEAHLVSVRVVGNAALGGGADSATVVEEDHPPLGRSIALHDRGHIQQAEVRLHA